MVNILDAAELYTYKWLKRYVLCYYHKGLGTSVGGSHATPLLLSYPRVFSWTFWVTPDDCFPWSVPSCPPGWGPGEWVTQLPKPYLALDLAPCRYWLDYEAYLVENETKTVDLPFLKSLVKNLSTNVPKDLHFSLTASQVRRSPTPVGCFWPAFLQRIFQNSERAVGCAGAH